MKNLIAATVLGVVDAQAQRGFPFMRMFGAVGWKTFTCNDPVFADVWFDPRDMGTHWKQTHATWGTGNYGCVTMDISYDIADIPKDNSRLTKFTLTNTWTLIYAPWNSLEKGSYSHTYDITSKANGELMYTSWGYTDSFSTILETDYTTYILQYKCKQSYLDFVTEEYIDILTPDGTITEDLLNYLKAVVTRKMPNFNIEGLLAPARTKDCDTVNAWGII